MQVDQMKQACIWMTSSKLKKVKQVITQWRMTQTWRNMFKVAGQQRKDNVEVSDDWG